MSLIQFLKESTNHSKIIMQTLLDNLDDGHVDYNSDKISVNVGNIVKQSKFSNLTLVFVRGEKVKIKLAKSKKLDGYVILVRTEKELPKRMGIDSFIADNNRVFNGVSSQIDAYIARQDFAESDGTSFEKSKKSNSSDSFEEVYQKFTDEVKQKVDEYKKIGSDLKQKMDTTNNSTKQVTIDLAIKKLKKETIGSNKNEFMSIAQKLIGDELKELNSELKQKMQKRIESYYDQIINSID